MGYRHPSEKKVQKKFKAVKKTKGEGKFYCGKSGQIFLIEYK